MRSRRPIQPSYEELLSIVRDLPAGYRGQIFGGAVHVVEPASAARAHALAEISAMVVAGSALGDPVPEAWSFLSNVELSVGEEAFVVADVAGWRVGTGELARAGTPVRLVPAWVCEVLGSGAARRFTLTAKRKAYAELGVAHLWLVDPEAGVLDVYVNQKSRWTLLASIADEPRASAAPFDELHFDAGDLWLPQPTLTPTPPSSSPSSGRRRWINT